MFAGSRLNSTSKRFNPCSMISHFNLGTCEGCNKQILKGQHITRVAESEGIRLRFRTHVNGDFYRPSTGSRIVHRNCQILDHDGYYFWTDWSANQMANNLH